MNEIEIAFNTLANVAGGKISNKTFVRQNIDTNIRKTHLRHQIKEFYCISVPGKSFVIKSNDKISITGNCVHAEAMIKVFRLFIEENRDIWKDELKSELYAIAEQMVKLEDDFIDVSYEMGSPEGLTKDDLKKYIRYIADRRLISMGLKGIFKQKKNPLPWVDEMISAPQHTNFFENKSTAYGKGALTGSWGDVWGAAS